MARKLTPAEKRNRAIVRRQERYLGELSSQLGRQAEVQVKGNYFDLTSRQKIEALDKAIRKAQAEIRSGPKGTGEIVGAPEQPEPEVEPEVLIDIWDNEVRPDSMLNYERKHIRLAGRTFKAALNYQEEIPIPTRMFIDREEQKLGLTLFRLVIGDSGGVPDPNQPFHEMKRQSRRDNRKRRGDRHKKSATRKQDRHKKR